MRKRKKSYEGSPADKRQDAREAKKRGMSMKDWERSAADKAQDAAGESMPGLGLSRMPGE